METVALKAQALGLGFDLVGVCPATPTPHFNAYREWLDRGFHGDMEFMMRQAELRADPKSVLASARSIIAVGLNYYQPVEHQPGQPRIARYALGRDYHKVLRGKLRVLNRWIQAEHPGAEGRPAVDSAPIFDRSYASMAGLGWFGKNTCLINSHRGSWFFIGLLLTSVEFEPDEPSVGGCGNCRACIEACPTGAIVFADDRWQVDARECISALNIEHRGDFSESQAKRIGEWTVGCDVCQEVCPFNHERPHQPLRAQVTSVEDFKARQWPTLEELSRMDRSQWDRQTQGSAARRISHEDLKRNALANLANASRAPVGE